MVKTYDYDGTKYYKSDTPKVIENINKNIEKLKGELLTNDKNIFSYFKQVAKAKGKEKELDEFYSQYYLVNEQYDKDMEFYKQLINATSFFQIITPPDKIIKNMKEVLWLEKTFKEKLKTLMENKALMKETHNSKPDDFEYYMSNDLVYFEKERYNDKNVHSFYNTMHYYQILLNKYFFITKKNLLEFQATLI